MGARDEVGDPEVHASAGLGAAPPGVACEHPQVRCAAVCESPAARQRGSAFLRPVWRPAKDPGCKTEVGSKMRDYIDEINNLYPADIVNYYSPNYAEDLLKKLEE